MLDWLLKQTPKVTLSTDAGNDTFIDRTIVASSDVKICSDIGPETLSTVSMTRSPRVIPLTFANTLISFH